MLTEMATVSLLDYSTAQIDYPTVNTLLSSLWQQLNSQDMPISCIKKVYSVATESLENIFKYADSNGEETLKFRIKISGNYIEIHAENILKHVKVAKLEYNIDLVNSLDKIELKKLFKHKIQTRKISELGGAGLGLIIIARKIDGKITYSLSEIDKKYSRFVFTAKVPIVGPSEGII